MTTKTVMHTPHACTLDDKSTAVGLHAMEGGHVALRIYATNSACGIETSVHMSANECRRFAFELLRHAKAAEGGAEGEAQETVA